MRFVVPFASVLATGHTRHRPRRWNETFAATTTAVTAIAAATSSVYISAAYSTSSSTSCSAATTSSTTTNTMSTSPWNVRVIPSDKLYVSEPDPRWFGNGPNESNDPKWTNPNWLKSRFHFSFAEYHNRGNQQFGVLRVMNDDLVQPHRGFGTHPHSNMEIITYIVHGQLTHQDSMGTKESLGRGSIQFMTAGTGVQHSEFNHHDAPLRFIQTWIVPSRSNLKPNYGSYAGDDKCHRNTLSHLVSNVRDTTTQTPVQINQELDGYASELELGQKVQLDMTSNNRQAYLLCIEGSVNVNGQILRKYDACEITPASSSQAAEDGDKADTNMIDIEATDVEETEHGKLAHVLVFTMPHIPGSGRSDMA